jgi:transcriptional regulator with XRE-family HTH domain
MTPKQLKAWRVRNGWTQDQLADHLGVKAPTVSRWERDVHPISDRTERQVTDLARRLRIPPPK